MPTLQTLDLSAGFRNAMHRLATTFSVVTCADEGGWHGMTVTAVRADLVGFNLAPTGDSRTVA